jgi:hypothetical protein
MKSQFSRNEGLRLQYSKHTNQDQPSCYPHNLDGYENIRNTLDTFHYQRNKIPRYSKHQMVPSAATLCIVIGKAIINITKTTANVFV